MGLTANDDRLATRVGALVIALLVVAGLLMVSSDLHLRAQVRFQVYFEHLGALKEGADVQVAGRVIGEIESIGLIPAPYAEAQDHPLHPTGGIVANVRVEKRYAYMVLREADYFVSSKGLFGERYLEIGAPMTGRAHPRAEEEAAAFGGSIEEGAQIRGIDPPRMDRVLQRSYMNLVTSRVFLRAVEPHWRDLVRALNELSATLDTVEPEPGAYGRLGDSLSALSDRASAVRDKWHSGGVEIEDFRRLAARGRKTLDEIERSMKDLEERLDAVGGNIDRMRDALPEDFAGRFRVASKKASESFTKVRRIVATGRELLAMVERGEGNLGGLFNDPEFMDTAKKIGKVIKRTPWRVVGHPQD